MLTVTEKQMPASLKTYFRSLSLADLEALQTTAVARLSGTLADTRLTYVSMGGKTFQFNTMSVEQTSYYLNEITQVLQEKDPDTYGKRVTKTVANFAANHAQNL